MNIKELAKKVQKMRSLQKKYFDTRSKSVLGDSKARERELDLLVEKILAEPDRATDITIEQINGVDYVSTEQLARALGIASQNKPNTSALSPSDFGCYLADELEQFDRYLAEFEGGVSFEEWVNLQIQTALWL
jgi:hypothetical protein